MYLGVEEQSGYVYEGTGSAEILAVPTPSVTQAKLIERPEDWENLPLGLSDSSQAWHFREDTFDAVTRTRRGRLYESRAGQMQPSTVLVRPHLFEDPTGRSTGAGGRASKSLFVYTACHSLLSKPRQGHGMTLALGSPLAASAWRIVQVEVVASRCVMVTLKSLSAFGILPDIDLTKIDDEHRPPVVQAFDRALTSAFRETAISIVDHCRNALTVLLARWLAQRGCDRSILSKDLSSVSNMISEKPYDKKCVANLARTVALLHVRGKANEQHSHESRSVVEEDAEMAIHALGFALRDLGWAKPS